MGYAVYPVGKRFGGYGVPTICEHPGCNKKIDRGIDYACGGEPFSEYGCDRYFCEDHREWHEFNTGCGSREGAFVCNRCAQRKLPFPYKPETREWVDHLLTDESWEEWRKENQDKVKELKNNL
jgi:hypothetical protein